MINKWVGLARSEPQQGPIRARPASLVVGPHFNGRPATWRGATITVPILWRWQFGRTWPAAGGID